MKSGSLARDLSAADRKKEERKKERKKEPEPEPDITKGHNSTRVSHRYH